MSYHLPIVASDLEATRLVTLPDDSYCAAGDSESLKLAIEHILAQPFIPIQYDLSAYDWTTIAQRTFNVYSSLL